MALFKKKPVVVEAHQWLKNGDHPDDKVGEPMGNPLSRKLHTRLEGAVVRFYRDPNVDGNLIHGDMAGAVTDCRWTMHDHGFIDTLEGGHTVCPGDWIITGVQGERYPCKPDIFQETYEAVAVDNAIDNPDSLKDLA